MNRVDTDEMSWGEKVMVFRAVCKNYRKQDVCTNCPNCVYFKMREVSNRER